jgi:heat-inducible transcriptional repressor
MAGDIISERNQLLLKTLIERYIKEGQPVGSKSLLQETGLSISSATVRNVMVELEDRGYITSPHTSAGRVPTAQGYRLFVDSLISMQPMDDVTLRGLRVELDPDKSSTELAAAASQLLSSITSQAGLVSIPRQEKQSLRQVEFLPLSDNRVLVILVINGKEVQNRVIHTARQYSEIELQQATNMINQRYAGQNLDEIRAGIVSAMQQDKETIDSYMQSTLDLAKQAFEPEDSAQADYVMAGESQLVNMTSPAEMDRLKELFGAFERKKDILELVDRCLHAEGVQIFIGEEAGYEVLGDFSVVTAPYQFSGETLGVLGVIGPTRMAYEKVIPIVDVTARMLTMALSKT